MRIVLAVIRREYLQRVRSRWFILTTLGLPVLMIGVMAIPLVVQSRSEAREGVIAIVDGTGVLFDHMVSDLGESFQVERVPLTRGVFQSLDQRVLQGEISGYLTVSDETVSTGRAVFRGLGDLGPLRRLRLQGAVARSVLRLRLAGNAGGDGLDELLAGGSIEFVNLGPGALAEGAREVGMVAGFVGALMLYMVILLYGVQVMRAVLEEKTSRIVEIVISTLKPWQLMLGKILGVGAVGLTQMAIWASSTVLFTSFVIPRLVGVQPQLLELEGLLDRLPVGGGIALFVAFFVLGYFLYSSLYAAVAAMCSSEEEAQQTQFPVTLLLIVPVMFLSPIMTEPNGALATWLSLVPFFSPVLMFPRYIGGAPHWQVGLSLVLMALAVFVVAWLAGRIYRVGILMQGKRPTLHELARWIREAS